MPSQEDIDSTRGRLAAHRATLAHCLQQQATLGSAYAPPGVAATIREARRGIAACKAALRGWGTAVEDLPDDDEVDDRPGDAGRDIGARGAAAPPEAPAAVQAEYAPALSEIAMGWAGLAVGAILGLAWLGRGAGIALGLVSGDSPWGFVGVGAIALYLGVEAGHRAYRAMRRRVRVLPDGLEITQGRHADACRWEDIEAMWAATSLYQPPRSLPRAGQGPHPPGPRYVSSGYRLSLVDGRVLSVPMGLRGYPALIDAIKSQVQARRLPRCRAQYLAQGEVIFGTKLSVSRRGVRLGPQLVPWERVVRAGYDDTMVWLERGGTVEKTSISLEQDTPNHFVFAALVNEIAGAMASRGAPHGREP